MDDEISSFRLQTGVESFVSRSQDVFASLGAIEDKHSAFLKAVALSHDKDNIGLIKNDPDEDDEFVHQNKNDAEGCRSWSHGRSQLSKTENIDYEARSRSRSPNRDSGPVTTKCGSPQDADGDFKRPAQPSQRLTRKSTPDFKKHPEKYTFYSLGDVPEQEMSETSNQRAAFDFLEEKRLEKEKQEIELAGLQEEEEEPKFDVVNAACSQGKIPFSHPKQKKQQSNTPDKSTSKDSVESSGLKLSLDVIQNDIEQETKDTTESESAPDGVHLEGSHLETISSSNTFKSRKNVKRHIRKKSSDADSD